MESCPSLNSGERPLLTRSLIPPQTSATKPVEELIQTTRGKILVARQGDQKKPAIVTYHDLGLNYLSNFQTFFNSGAMQTVKENFCIYHVTAPGQESGAEDLPDGYEYPTMEELSDQVEYVCHYYGIPHFVAFGVGLGANVLVRFAHRRPTMVDGLILINCSSQTAGWVEWMYHKVNIKNLKKHILNTANNSTGSMRSITPPLPETVVDYLIWYHLGRPDSEGRTIEAATIASVYKQYFNSHSETNAKNLSLLIQSYMQRTDLGLAREIAANGKAMLGSTRTLKMPVLNMTGDYSPHIESTVTFNGRLQPNKCTWMKIQDAGMILEEQPGKVSEAVKLFLQGLGHTIVLLKKVNPTPVNPKWMSETLTTSQMTTTGRSVSLSATPIKAAKAELQEGSLLEGLQDLKIKFSTDDNYKKPEETNGNEEQLLPI